MYKLIKKYEDTMETNRDKSDNFTDAIEALKTNAPKMNKFEYETRLAHYKKEKEKLEVESETLFNVLKDLKTL